ncbi:MAG: enoyl-CoA hydratase-related protein [Flavobacteriales bacterium]
MSNTIITRQENNVTWLWLNRPTVFNSFNREMAFALQQELDRCESDTEIRAVVLTGSGKAFCAGQDLAEASDPNGPGLQKILSEHYNPIITRIRNLSKPVVAAVNGVAAGAGANIALCCDVVVAAESASFIQAFSKIGLIPDSGGTFFLPRLIGFQKASALMMMADKVSAAEAERMGMLYKVFAGDALESETKKIAEYLAAMPTKGFALTKRALNNAMNNTLDAQLALEEDLQIQCGLSHDYKEGVSAFLEKRKPQFKGE